MTKRWLSPLADAVFKRIFGQEKEILIELINAFIELEEPVVDIEYLTQELLHDVPDGKISVVDVRCIDNKKRNFILEIQLIRQISFQERVLYYASKTYGRQLLKNRKYEELQPVYLLSILDHIFDNSSPDWLHRYSLINESDISKKLNGIHLIFIELEKCRKCANFTMDKTQQRWITFLTEPEKIISMSKHELHDYPNLVKAVELLDESNYTPGQLIAYDKYMDSIITWNSTMIESFDNGFDQGTINAISIIQALKKGDITEEEIAKTFNTTTEVVQQLKDLL
jgi:predicted transposase/invertase (TIGR01784 family)